MPQHARPRAHLRAGDGLALIGGGAQARAAAYLEVRVGDSAPVFGVGIDANIVRATLLAVLSATSRGATPVAVEQGVVPAVA